MVFIKKKLKFYAIPISVLLFILLFAFFHTAAYDVGYNYITSVLDEIFREIAYIIYLIVLHLKYNIYLIGLHLKYIIYLLVLHLKSFGLLVCHWVIVVLDDIGTALRGGVNWEFFLLFLPLINAVICGLFGRYLGARGAAASSNCISFFAIFVPIYCFIFTGQKIHTNMPVDFLQYRESIFGGASRMSDFSTIVYYYKCATWWDSCAWIASDILEVK